MTTLATLITLTLTATAPAGVPAKLAKRARHVAANGGVTGDCWGCATPLMRELTRRVVAARFRPAGGYAVRVALCIVSRESGFNPGAVNHRDPSGGSHGLAQINGAHRWRYDFGRIYDPVYNAGVMWAMSRGGRSWGPWTTHGGCV